MKLLLALPFFAVLAVGQGRQVAVISHRGEHLRHPENTLPAYLAAVGIGADYVEVDVRTTADGKLVLMHDSTVDRTTNGKGAIASMTFDEMRALDAGVKVGPQFSGTRVPTFEEALNAVKGRAGVYVDAKSVTAKDLVGALEQCGMLERVVVYGGVPLLKELATLRPKIKVMPESVSASVIRSLIGDLMPRVIAFSNSDWQDEIIQVARDAAVDIYVDRLGAQDNPEFWRDAIERGATGIQTDRVAELLEFLRSSGRHK